MWNRGSVEKYLEELVSHVDVNYLMMQLWKNSLRDYNLVKFVGLPLHESHIWSDINHISNLRICMRAQTGGKQCSCNIWASFLQKSQLVVLKRTCTMVKLYSWWSIWLFRFLLYHLLKVIKKSILERDHIYVKYVALYFHLSQIWCGMYKLIMVRSHILVNFVFLALHWNWTSL